MKMFNRNADKRPKISKEQRVLYDVAMRTPVDRDNETAKQLEKEGLIEEDKLRDRRRNEPYWKLTMTGIEEAKKFIKLLLPH